MYDIIWSTLFTFDQFPFQNLCLLSCFPHFHSYPFIMLFLPFKLLQLMNNKKIGVARFWFTKANFPQEATFFSLCHLFFLHSPLFKSCCHTTFEFLSHCWGWASLLERAATAAASQQLNELKFKLGWEALSTQQSSKKNWWQTNFEHLF